MNGDTLYIKKEDQMLFFKEWTESQYDDTIISIEAFGEDSAECFNLNKTELIKIKNFIDKVISKTP